MTAQEPRKGEPSSASMRYGLRLQPAHLVRGSSRRIMTMRFRPANIRVINRRVCCWAVIGPAVPKSRLLPSTRLRAHQRERVPAKPPVEAVVDARTVLAVKGSLRRAKHRRALDGSAPFRRDGNRDGRLRREHFTDAAPKKRPASLLAEESRPENKTRQTRRGLTESLHIRTLTIPGLARPA